MLVSCCSVVLSTFASAYTTTDGTNPKYGVYTYDFLKADGTSAYGTNGSVRHNLLACGGPTDMAVGNANQVQRRYLAGASRIETSGANKGMHLVGYSNATAPYSAPSWSSRAFILDPNAGISNEKGYLCLQDNTTYTFILKYKLESLDAAYYAGLTYNPNISNNTAVNAALEGTTAAEGAYAATKAYIGLGYLNPITANSDSATTNDIYDAKITATSGTSGESTVFTDGWSQVITAAQDEWQYLNITVNANDVILKKPSTQGILSKYVQILVRPYENEKPVMFHIESLTVVAIDNSVADKYTVYDNSTADGTLTENVKVARSASNVHTIDFIKEDGTSAYPANGAIHHNLLSCGHLTYPGGGYTQANKRGDYAGVSYVDNTGMHLAGYSAANITNATNWATRAFILDETSISKPANAANGANFLYLKDNTTYTFIMKYRLESLDAAYEIGKVDGTKAAESDPAAGAYIGLGFMNPVSGTLKQETSISNTTGTSGETYGFVGGISPLIKHKQNEWQYLTVTVNADDMVLNRGSEGGLQTKYVQIYVRPSSGEKLVMFHIESITVITEENGVAPEDVTLVSIDKTGINAINATDYAGMTLPRPTDVDGYIGSNWVDKNDAAVTTVPATPGINFIYADYKYNKYDYEGLGGVYDPNNKFSIGYLNSLYWDDFSPDSSKNISIRWYELFQESSTRWANSNLSYLAFADGVNNKTGLTVKPNTTYKVTFDYYVTELPEAGKFGVQIRCVASSHIGVSGGTTIKAPTITDKVSEGTNWQTFTYEFTTPKDVTATPYFALLFHNSGTRAAANAEVFGKAFIDNIELIEVNAVNYEDAVADSYTSIREEIADEKTSALRVSAAISENDAADADEIGFIALPTKKTTADWYKFDAEGKLANGALSVKVKDVNGLGIKDAEGNDLGITELLAPASVPVAGGQKAYQVVIDGLRRLDGTGADLRKHAISVVLYTLKDGVYTYYFANEVSYDQTMTKLAMAGNDVAKYEY